jgi:hypothetical protein
MEVRRLCDRHPADWVAQRCFRAIVGEVALVVLRMPVMLVFDGMMVLIRAVDRICV